MHIQQDFFKKLGFPIFLTLWLSNFMQKIRQVSSETLCCGQMNGQTDKRMDKYSQVHRTLQLEWM